MALPVADVAALAGRCDEDRTQPVGGAEDPGELLVPPGMLGQLGPVEAGDRPGQALLLRRLAGEQGIAPGQQGEEGTEPHERAR